MSEGENINVETNVEGTPTSEGQQGQYETQPPAEAQKTEESLDNWDDKPGWAPGAYRRFYETLQKNKEYETSLNEAKSKLEEFEANKDSYEFATKLNQFLIENPHLEEEMAELIKRNQEKAAANPEQAQVANRQPIDPIVATLFQNQVKSVENQYLDKFHVFAKEKGIPESQINVFRDLTAKYLNEENPNFLMSFDPKALEKALQKTSVFVEDFKKSVTAGYVKDKQGSMMPASTTAPSMGAVATQSKGSRSQLDRSKDLAERMKAIASMPNT